MIYKESLKNRLHKICKSLALVHFTKFDEFYEHLGKAKKRRLTEKGFSG